MSEIGVIQITYLLNMNKSVIFLKSFLKSSSVLRVVCESDVKWSTIHGFVTDRLRSIRQDMVIQQPPPAVCRTILEPIVRFHAYSTYR